MQSGKIRSARLEDAAHISEIYNYYVQNTEISFEEEPVGHEEMARRIEATELHYPWIVYESEGSILGYAYASRWKDRSAYRFVAETTIYVSVHHLGKGIGTALIAELLRRLDALKLHALMAVIALPNEKSIAIHEKFGFKKAAHFTEVGYKHGRWIDVGYWEKWL